MSIIPIYETTFTNEQDKYNPDSLNNICTRLSVVQKLKNSIIILLLLNYLINKSFNFFNFKTFKHNTTFKNITKLK